MSIVGYVRVSTAEQSKEGVSLAAQQERIKRYAEFNQLGEIEILIEEAISATKPLAKRPKGAELLARIDAGEITGVIVTKHDRLSRKLVDAATLLEEWEGRVSLHLIDEGGTIDTSTPDGFFQAMMRALLSEYEARQIRSRTTTALRHKKATGQVYNHAPYGHEAKDGKLLPNDAEQAVIATMRDMREQGDSWQRIADCLNDKNIPTKIDGGKWHGASVRMIVERVLEINKLLAGQTDEQ